MAKKDDMLEHRRRYAKIKAMEKEKLQKSPPNKMTPEREHLRLCFARWCWNRRNTLAPSGKTWEQVFKDHWGIDLLRFSEAEQQRQRENNAVRNIVDDPAIP
jgi:hypothetical protein|tara:strand:+ start:295 stop:600 length:306 start_codon:yes stop_codon:yes gene_type:complete